MTVREAIERAADEVTARKVGPLPVTREGRRSRAVERPTKDVDGQPKKYPKNVSPADREVLRLALYELAAASGRGIDTLRGADDEWAWFETRRQQETDVAKRKEINPRTVPSRVRAWRHLLAENTVVAAGNYTIEIDAAYRDVLTAGKRRPERVLDLSIRVRKADGEIVVGARDEGERRVERLERKNSDSERAYLLQECAELITTEGLDTAEIDLASLRGLRDNLVAAAERRKKIKVIASATGFVILVGCAALLQYILKPGTIHIQDVKGSMFRDDLGRPHPSYVVTWTSTFKAPCSAFQILRDGVEVTASKHVFLMPGTNDCAFEDRSPPLADPTHVREVHYRVAYGTGLRRSTSPAARSCDECINEVFSMVARGFPIAEYEAEQASVDGKVTMVGLDTPFDLTFVDVSHANKQIDVRQHPEVLSDLQVECDFGDGTPATTLPVGAIRHVYNTPGQFTAMFTPLGVQMNPVKMRVTVSERGDRVGGETAKRLIRTVPDNGELVVWLTTAESPTKNVVHARRGEKVTLFCGVSDDVREKLSTAGGGYAFTWFEAPPEQYVFNAQDAEAKRIPAVWRQNAYLMVSHTWMTAGTRTLLITAADSKGKELARYLAEVEVH